MHAQIVEQIRALNTAGGADIEFKDQVVELFHSNRGADGFRHCETDRVVHASAVFAEGDFTQRNAFEPQRLGAHKTLDPTGVSRFATSAILLCGNLRFGWSEDIQLEKSPAFSDACQSCCR